MVAERVSSFNVMTFSKHIFSRFCQMGQGQDENCRRLSSDCWGRTHPPGCHLADRMTRFFHTTDWAARRSDLIETGISTIAKLMPNCLILSDALNHNSMIEGVREVHCEKQIFLLDGFRSKSNGKIELV